MSQPLTSPTAGNKPTSNTSPPKPSPSQSLSSSNTSSTTSLHSRAPSQSMNNAAGLKSFKEINSLKTELKELQVKYDNQQLLLDKASSSPAPNYRGSINADDLRAEQALQAQGIESSSASVPSSSTTTITSQPSITEYLQLQQLTHSFQSQIQSLQSALLNKTEEYDINRAEKSALSNALAEKESQLDGVMKELAAAREEIDALKGERGENSSLVDKLNTTIAAYEEKLESNETRILSMEVEFKHLKTLQQEKSELEILVEKLRTLLLTTSKDSSKKNQDLLNSLQQTRQFLEELKSEYESYAANTRVEHELYKRVKGKELTELQEKYDTLKLQHYESSQEIHNEQIEIIETLQANYLEYRLMVENLFFTEAKNLEEKLAQQQAKYDQEIKYLIRAKDQQFLTMITAKDAKIMNLIEGTDFSKILIQHQCELEAMKKKHERDVEIVKELAGQENKKLILQLKKDIVDKSAEIDKYHTQILTWEKKLEQTLALLKKQKKLHVMKEESSERHAKEVQQQLQKAYTQIESLIQVKENLRHRILRLRLQVEGTADDSVPSIIKRLTKETKRLSTDLSMITFNYKTKSDSYEQLQKGHERLAKQVENLEKELMHRTKEYKALTQTYESFLTQRLKSGVATGAQQERQSMYDPAVTKLLNTLSQPFIEALFKYKQPGGTMKETMLRATSARPAASPTGDNQQQQTMVGLRLGPTGPIYDQQPHTDEKNDPFSQQQQSTTVQQSSHFQSTHSSTADLESATVVQPQLQPQSKHSSRGGSALISKDLSPQPPTPDNAHTHGRHVSLTTGKVQLSGSPTPAPGLNHSQSIDAFQSGYASPYPSQNDQQQFQQQQPQQQQQQPPQSFHPSASASSLEAHDLGRPNSRSARLHELIKLTANVHMPDEIRPLDQPKSLKEQNRREKAAAEKNASAAEPTPRTRELGEEDEQDAGAGVVGARKRKKKVIKYQKPSKLTDIESSAELVDLQSIRQLERGFNMLERFKATSANFESDARGRLRRDAQDQQQQLQQATHGIGAFARSQDASTFNPMSSSQHQHQQHWDRHHQHMLESHESVAEKATRLYAAAPTSPSTNSFGLDGDRPPTLDSNERGDDSQTQPLEPIDDETLKQEYALHLNLQQYVDPHQQLESMNVVGQDGEESRLYQPTSTSAVPWWSSAFNATSTGGAVRPSLSNMSPSALEANAAAAFHSTQPFFQNVTHSNTQAAGFSKTMHPKPPTTKRG